MPVNITRVLKYVKKKIVPNGDFQRYFILDESKEFFQSLKLNIRHNSSKRSRVDGANFFI